jgi:conjugal transfer ATP-binding protein TraC
MHTDAPNRQPSVSRPARPSLFGFGQTQDTPAEQFAAWLPYSAYLSAEKLFVNRDSVGFMLEVMPQSGADERMAEVLISLYSTCPPGTGIQFHLFASPHLRDQLRRYANLRVEDLDQADKAKHWGRPARNDNLFHRLARQRVGHLLQGAQTSLTSGFHYTIRDFRLMMSVAIAADAEDLTRRDELMALRESMASTLRSASLPNRVCDAADLINWCALFTNPDRISQTDAPNLHYDDGRELRDQIIDFDTIQDPHAGGLTLWKEGGDDVLEARFYSIKSFPERFALWQMGSLIGDLMQPALQYSAPFLLTMGVHVLDPNVMKSVVTANHVRATQNAKSKMADVMPDVGKKLQDWTAAANAIDIGSSLVSLYHQLAIFTPPHKAVAAQETANAIWRGRGFQLNADVYMHRQALLASLPMTLSEKFHKDLAKMRRVSRKTMANAIHLAPLIAEWRGTRTPALVFGGRRGQLMTLDIFDNDLGNYNFAIIGAPGSGKSVLMNEMAWSYRAIDAKVWMLDLGRSFEKLCRKAKGTYIEFKPDVDICLNPFTRIVDINEDIDMLVPAISKMASMSRPAGRGSVQGHLGDGAKAVQGPRQRPHGHRAARRLQGRDHRGTRRTQRPADQGPRDHAEPVRTGRPVRALLRGPQQRRLRQRLRRHRERGAEAPARPARGGQHPAAAPDHRRDVPDAQPAQGAVHR